jgi:chromate reductase
MPIVLAIMVDRTDHALNFFGGDMMSEKIKILGIAGSLRKDSFNQAALRAAAGLVPVQAEIEIYDIDGFPGFNQDLDQEPPGKVTEFKRTIRGADAILFSSPEYNYSIPGVLKNAIDWASRPYGDSAWEGKPAAIMGCSPGNIGTARMQYHLRQVMVFLNMFPLNRPEVMIGKCVEKFDAAGNLTDEKTREFIRQMLVSLVDWTERLRGDKAAVRSL